MVFYTPVRGARTPAFRGGGAFVILPILFGDARARVPIGVLTGPMGGVCRLGKGAWFVAHGAGGVLRTAWCARGALCAM